MWPSLRATRGKKGGNSKSVKSGPKELSKLLKIQVLSEVYEDFSFQRLPFWSGAWSCYDLLNLICLISCYQYIAHPEKQKQRLERYETTINRGSRSLEKIFQIVIPNFSRSVSWECASLKLAQTRKAKKEK